MALAWVLGTSISTLMRPAEDLGEVRFRSWDVISGRWVTFLASGYNDDGVSWDGDGAKFTPDSGEQELRTVILPRLPAPPGIIRPASSSSGTGGCRRRRPGSCRTAGTYGHGKADRLVHGTDAHLQPGDLIMPGHKGN